MLWHNTVLTASLLLCQGQGQGGEQQLPHFVDKKVQERQCTAKEDVGIDLFLTHIDTIFSRKSGK